MWMSQHRSFWPGFIESGIVLSNQSPEQGQGYPSRQWRCSHLYGTARRGEQRMRRREEQSCREWGDFSGERDDDRSHSSSCEASRFSCVRPLVANTWFYFVFKLLWNRLQSYIPAEPQHPGFSFQADAQNSEVLFSYKHVLWLPLCLAIHIPWTHLWEKIICLHQKQLLHHLMHVSPFTWRGSLILNPSNLPRTRLSPFRFTSCAFLRTKGQKTALMTSETCSSVPGQLHFAFNWMVLWRHRHFMLLESQKKAAWTTYRFFVWHQLKRNDNRKENFSDGNVIWGFSLPPWHGAEQQAAEVNHAASLHPGMRDSFPHNWPENERT